MGSLARERSRTVVRVGAIAARARVASSSAPTVDHHRSHDHGHRRRRSTRRTGHGRPPRELADVDPAVRTTRLLRISSGESRASDRGHRACEGGGYVCCRRAADCSCFRRERGPTRTSACVDRQPACGGRCDVAAVRAATGNVARHTGVAELNRLGHAVTQPAERAIPDRDARSRSDASTVSV